MLLAAFAGAGVAVLTYIESRNNRKQAAEILVIEKQIKELQLAKAKNGA